MTKSQPYMYSVLDKDTIEMEIVPYLPMPKRGLSPTGTGVSYMVLGDGNKIDLRNVMHEIMHSLGLHHTFIKDGESTTKFTHKFKKRKNQKLYGL